MPSLDAYINFSVILNKSTTPPQVKIIDTGSYPVLVAPTIIGYFSVQEPDGMLVTVGSFSSPSIYWSSGALTQPITELRLNTAGAFQNGTYVISYYIRATGYSDTTLTKEFNLNYTQPILTLVKGFDLFTPQLAVTDGTTYTQANMSNISTARTWAANIITVSGVERAISGSGVEFDLNYMGSYYDSRYDITLTANPQYVLSSPNDWVTLTDNLITTQTYYAEIPPTLAQLLTLLTTYKYNIDNCICGKNCGCNECQVAKANYVLAVSIYAHLVDRGQAGQLSGLSLYVLQLQKLLNNCVTPTYVNTNGVIPAYDFGGGSGGSVAWADITGKPATIKIEWTVGAVGFPGAGATTMTDARFANVNVQRIEVFRNALLQFNADQGDGDTYVTKASDATNTIGFSAALNTGEKLQIFIQPL